MILNTTYRDKGHRPIINDLVGKPFSFIEIIRRKGIGSKRLVIEEVSPNLKPYMNSVSDINYANIELRPYGILIFINKGLSNFTWIVPYYQLVIYKMNCSSIHAQGRFVHFMVNKNFKESRSFFNKLWDAKINFDMKYNFTNNMDDF
ncbi:hypothetical protein HCG49_17945 [Arenibacter sp. 6A1]|uniref:hypothetical protein n=1 Tax=Arenibacter sp. 6A1 TaxID=2720391 RepID=UPI001445966F|nr:hypothetical protein [Arenibacter sp. 6A1]NKI28437.1 hypothetical protein [Arenibacter sp. 6A1]